MVRAGLGRHHQLVMTMDGESAVNSTGAPSSVPWMVNRMTSVPLGSPARCAQPMKKATVRSPGRIAGGLTSLQGSVEPSGAGGHVTVEGHSPAARRSNEWTMFEGGEYVKSPCGTPSTNGLDSTLLTTNAPRTPVLAGEVAGG